QASTQLYPRSLHDALPICQRLLEHEAGERLLNTLLEQFRQAGLLGNGGKQRTDSTYVIASVRDLNRLELAGRTLQAALDDIAERSEEHTSELQSRENLVCR